MCHVFKDHLTGNCSLSYNILVPHYPFIAKADCLTESALNIQCMCFLHSCSSNSPDHSVIYKRKIKDLSKEEKNSFILLKTGQPDVKANSEPKMADEFRNVVQIQSHEGFLLHIQ